VNADPRADAAAERAGPQAVALLSLSWPPDPGGGGIQLAHLAERLARHVAVRALAPAPASGARPVEPEGVSVETLAVPAWPRLRGRAFGLRAAAWLLRRSDWDLLHVSGFFPFAAAPIAAALARGRPSIVKVTELRPGGILARAGGLGALELSVVRRADRFVAVSAAIRDALRAAGVPDARIARIPNGVDVERFRPPEEPEAERAALRRELGLPDDAVVVVCCGLVVPRKNPLAVVRAAARMRARPLAVLLVGPSAGDADYEAELDRAAASLPPGVRMLRAGRRDPDETARILRCADVLAHASRFEGMPNAVLEALASGLPVVAHRIPGCSDALEHGGGALVPEDDEPALARALDELTGDPSRRRAVSADARRIACEHFALDAVAGRYRSLYRELLEARSRRRK